MTHRACSIILLCLACLGLPATAQTKYSRADTVRAVRALFEERRASASSLATAGGITIGLAAAATVAGAAASDDLSGAAVYMSAIGLGAVGVPLLLVGKSRQKEVTPEREGAAIGAYEQGQPLPSAISSRLRRRHFAVPRDGK
ncbi:hypothetical protein [Hymenobacter arizonensis]|uniref:Uncharacterized protein n=1 Tax=Hymenobacter arizonensis TaxID=1227077 RepID=A0A1I5ZP68_HYMAR|nr:hypothetical protein [Hymenobacter arizonensis]SFQ58286.1 hypothetical protein SAMN04515668_3088 [Hymenobacter arizonensis]